jgi:hypothetical protein
MTPSDADFPTSGERARKPYVAPQVIFSELYARGVRAKDPATLGQPEYHSPSTESTS